MKLQPLADRIVAKPEIAESKSSAGILLPEQAKSKTQIAVVTAVGVEVKEVKVGDRIITAQYGPDNFTQDKDEFVILKEKDVLAVIKG
jgi:chaperonin GroES